MKNMEFFTAKPNLHQVYGRTVTKELEFNEYTENELVHQTMKDCILTTEIHNESEFNGIKTIEESKLVQIIPEGTRIIWNEQAGYIIPNVQVCTLEELKEDIEDIKNIYNDVYRSDENDITGNEKESVEVN